MTISNSINGRSGGAPANKVATVPAGTTGALYTLRRSLGAGSTFTKVSGNANLSISSSAIALAAGLASAASQSMIVREANGTRAVEYQVTLTGAGAASAFPTFASMVGFGDSITAATGASTYANGWITLFAAAIGAGAPLDKGASGTPLVNDAGAANNGRDRFSADILGANKRALVTIAYGINDVRLGAPSYTAANFSSDLREILNGAIVGGYAPSDILILSPYYVADGGLNGQTRARLLDYVAAAAAVAAEYGTWYKDIYAYMLANGGDALMSGDLLHPSDAGHAVISAGAQTAQIANTRARPATVTLSSSGAGTLNIAVTAVSGAASYEVEYGTAASFAYANTKTPSGTSDSWTGVGDGTYRARARAVFGDGGKGPWTFSSQTVVLGSAVFASDSFTDTAETLLTAHAAELGGAWSLVTGFAPATPNKIDSANRLYSPTATGVYQIAATPPSPDYAVKATLDLVSVTGAGNVGVAGRTNGAGAQYFARYNAANRTFQLGGGSPTMTTLSTAADLFGSGSCELELRMQGSTLSLWKDGTKLLEGTDASLSAAGKASVRMAQVQTDSTGVHIASFEARVL